MKYRYLREKIAELAIKITGYYPAIKNLFSKFIRISYFLPPTINQSNKSRFLQLKFNKKADSLYLPFESRQRPCKTAIITGATSGIGKAFAVYFAKHGYNLVITGRRKEIIQRVAEEIKNTYGVNVEVIIADLSKKEDLSAVLKAIGRLKSVDVLINNAGYGTGIRFAEDDINNQLSMLRVHVDAPLMLIHKVLPGMMHKKSGIIINVSSLSAFTPTARNALYASTKLFLKNFSESLYMDVSQYGIKVQCLCPGFTRSDFHRNRNTNFNWIGLKFIRWMEPHEVVEYSIHYLKKGGVICIPGTFNRILIKSIYFIPRKIYYTLINKLEEKIMVPESETRMACLQ
jgi:short-subunit dehydrogenase